MITYKTQHSKDVEVEDYYSEERPCSNIGTKTDQLFNIRPKKDIGFPSHKNTITITNKTAADSNLNE